MVYNIDYAKVWVAEKEREREREREGVIKSDNPQSLRIFLLSSMLNDQLGSGSLKVAPSGGVILSRTFQLLTKGWVVISLCASHEPSNSRRLQTCDVQV